jgi:hypothetical protein
MGKEEVAREGKNDEQYLMERNKKQNKTKKKKEGRDVKKRLL